MWGMGKGLCWIHQKRILGCVLIVLMRLMVSLRWGKAGMSVHEDVVMDAPFRLMIVGCVRKVLMAQVRAP